jgi:neutral trehalase
MLFLLFMFEGLLYLPYRYVVPGGRFNEMYGWDSYFTATGYEREEREKENRREREKVPQP